MAAPKHQRRNWRMASASAVLGLLISLWALLPAPASAQSTAQSTAQYALEVGGIFSSAQAQSGGSESLLRFYNSGATAGTVSVTLSNSATGQAVAQWTSPSIAPGTAPQFPITALESMAAAGFSPPQYYSASIQSQFAGSFQHVLWQQSDGTLTNLSTCNSGVTDSEGWLANVHSSLLGTQGYPSSIVTYNTGTSAAAATLTIADARNANQLFTYTTSAIPANGQQVVLVSDMEKAASFSPTAGMEHYVVTVGAQFTGYLQHLVDNQQINSFADMTTVCALGAVASPAASSTLQVGGVFSSAQAAAGGSASFLRFYNSGTTSGTVSVTLADSATGQNLGQWTSPSIAPGAAPQIAISKVEAAAGFGSHSYSVSIQSQFPGTFQHVLWNQSDGTLTNSSTCSSAVSAPATRLANVLSSRIGGDGYPSSIVVYNTGASSAEATLTVTDPDSGNQLFTYTTPTIAANGQQIVLVSAMEQAASFAPTSDTSDYVVTVNVQFTGYLQHLVNNQQVGAFTDMTAVCSLPTPSTLSNPVSLTANTLFEGTYAGQGGEQGAFNLLVVPPATSATAVPAVGRLAPNGQTAFTITGNYDPTTATLTATGNGYSLTGTAGASSFKGTYTDQNNRQFNFAALVAPSPTVYVAFCGTYNGGGPGWLSFVIDANGQISGEYVDPLTGAGYLAGQSTGTTVRSISAITDNGTTFTGTAQNGVLSGTYTGPEQARPYPFTANRCLPPAPPTGQINTDPTHSHLTIINPNDGAGTVVSYFSPPQTELNCTLSSTAPTTSGTCSEAFPVGQPVTVVAFAAPGWIITGWNTASCDPTLMGMSSTASNCVFVPIDGVTGPVGPLLSPASGTPTPSQTFTVSYTTSGTGTGEVSVFSGGGYLGNTPSPLGPFVAGTSVILAPTAGGGSVFAGWTGGCSGTSYYCTVTMNSNVSVNAVFNLPSPAATYVLRVTPALPAGETGTITSTPAGINCSGSTMEQNSNPVYSTSGTCAASFPANQPVTLSSTGAMFSWVGGCTGSTIGVPYTGSDTCQVPMNGNYGIGAIFK